MQRWTKERACEWYNSIPYPFGCNFLSSSAVNSTDMWQEETFDAKTIERELQFASGLGYNTVRVFMPFIVWDSDPQGLLGRVEVFLRLADRAGISMMPILFDDCAFAHREPYLGRQDDPVPGVHNSQWTPSPGFRITDETDSWPRLEAYVNDLLSTFGKDPRVLAWDLYNEPGNSERSGKSLTLLEAAYEWSRRATPMQPLTAGLWRWDKGMDAINGCCEEKSDIVSFHSYDDRDRTVEIIDTLSRHGRPLMCTEWLHRPNDSRFQTHLPLWKTRNVGIYNWGLIVGRTQTNLNWSTMSGSPDPSPEEWQHDLMFPDGSLYSDQEVATIREIVGINIEMAPVDMSQSVMQDLENRGLIIRRPLDKSEFDARIAQSGEQSTNERAARSDRSERLRRVAVADRQDFAELVSHHDNGEVLLIGEREYGPMYLVIALCMRDEFEEKVKTGRLSVNDLILLRCRYNDPNVSSFAIIKDVPHSEAVLDANLPFDIIEMRKYRIKVRAS